MAIKTRGCTDGHSFEAGRCARDACGARLTAREVARSGLEASQQAIAGLPDGSLGSLREEALRAIPRARLTAELGRDEQTRERAAADLAGLQMVTDLVRAELAARAATARIR